MLVSAGLFFHPFLRFSPPDVAVIDEPTCVDDEDHVGDTGVGELPILPLPLMLLLKKAASVDDEEDDSAALTTLLPIPLAAGAGEEDGDTRRIRVISPSNYSRTRGSRMGAGGSNKMATTTSSPTSPHDSRMLIRRQQLQEEKRAQDRCSSILNLAHHRPHTSYLLQQHAPTTRRSQVSPGCKSLPDGTTPNTDVVCDGIHEFGTILKQAAPQHW